MRGWYALALLIACFAIEAVGLHGENHAAELIACGAAYYTIKEPEHSRHCRKYFEQLAHERIDR